METTHLNGYPVVEHFYTLQGEGIWAGYPAYFVRLGGCDVGCSWCDTKYSWSTEGLPVLDVDTIVNAILASGAPRTVITGGEPVMHDLTLLANGLRNAGITSHLETSGAYPLRGRFDWVTLSPKRFKPPVDSLYDETSELKIVVANRKDFGWGESHAEKCGRDVKLTLQPEWSRAEQMLPEIISYIKSNPRWSISLQTHKFLNIR